MGFGKMELKRRFSKLRPVAVSSEIRSGSRDQGPVWEPRLDALPLNILVNIRSRLDLVSEICLGFVNQRLRASNTVDVKTANLTRCEKWLIMAKFEQDLLNVYVKTIKVEPKEKPGSTVDAFAPTAQARQARTGLVYDTPLSKAPYKPPRGSMATKHPYIYFPNTMPKSLAMLTCALCKTKHRQIAFLKMASVAYTALLPYTVDKLLRQHYHDRICTQHLWKYVTFRFMPASKFVYERVICRNGIICLHCDVLQELRNCQCAAESVETADEKNKKKSPEELEHQRRIEGVRPGGPKPEDLALFAVVQYGPKDVAKYAGPGPVLETCHVCPKVPRRIYERQRPEADRNQTNMTLKFEHQSGALVCRETRTPIVNDNSNNTEAKEKPKGTEYIVPVEYR